MAPIGSERECLINSLFAPEFHIKKNDPSGPSGRTLPGTLTSRKNDFLLYFVRKLGAFFAGVFLLFLTTFPVAASHCVCAFLESGSPESSNCCASNSENEDACPAECPSCMGHCQVQDAQPLPLENPGRDLAVFAPERPLLFQVQPAPVLIAPRYLSPRPPEISSSNLRSRTNSWLL